LSYLSAFSQISPEFFFDTYCLNALNPFIHIPHFPIITLTYNCKLITDATTANPAIAALATINTDVAGQKSAHGELGNLTPAQHANLALLQKWMNQARKTAKLAFVGQDVKLHQEFQVVNVEVLNTTKPLASIFWSLGDSGAQWSGVGPSWSSFDTRIPEDLIKIVVLKKPW